MLGKRGALRLRPCIGHHDRDTADLAVVPTPGNKLLKESFPAKFWLNVDFVEPLHGSPGPMIRMYYGKPNNVLFIFYREEQEKPLRCSPYQLLHRREDFVGVFSQESLTYSKHGLCAWAADSGNASNHSPSLLPYRFAYHSGKMSGPCCMKIPQ